MRINDLGSSAFQYRPEVTSKRAATERFSLDPEISELPTSTHAPAEISTKSYDTKHITLEDVWKLKDDLVNAGHAADLKGGPSMLRLFSMTHPQRIDGADESGGYPPTVDLFQSLAGYVEFAKSNDDPAAAADFQSFLNWFQSFADENGVIHIPNATADTATQG